MDILYSPVDAAKYIGRVFTRRDGPYNQRAVRLKGITKSGYAQCTEMTVIRLTENTSQSGGRAEFDLMGIVDEEITTTHPLRRFKVAKNNLNGNIVLVNKRQGFSEFVRTKR